MGKISQRERARQSAQLAKISTQLGRVMGTSEQLQVALPGVGSIVSDVQASLQSVTQGIADMVREMERQRWVNIHLVAQLTGHAAETVQNMEERLRSQFDGKEEGM